jgi:hypothetical protein
MLDKVPPLAFAGHDYPAAVLDQIFFSINAKFGFSGFPAASVLKSPKRVKGYQVRYSPQLPGTIAQASRQPVMAVYQVIMNAIPSGKAYKRQQKLGQQGVELKLGTMTALENVQVDYTDSITKSHHLRARLKRGARIDVDIMPVSAKILCQFPDVDAHAAGVTCADSTDRA